MKKNKSVKVVGIMLILAIIMTWFFESGSINGTSFQSNGVNPVGLSDIPVLLYYAIYFAIDKLVYLIFLAGCYGVLSKTSGYQKVVNSFGNIIKKYSAIIIPVISLLIIAFTVMTTQTFAVLAFLPFLISSLLKSGKGKLEVFAITFGSLFVGMIAPIYGTDGFIGFAEYTNLDYTNNIVLKVGVLFVGWLLLLFGTGVFNKKNKGRVLEEDNKDVFEIEETEKGTKAYPIIIVGCLVLIVTVLGFINWSDNFDITVFENINNDVLDVTVGEDLKIFANVFGTSEKAFGYWDLLTYSIVLLVATAITAFMYKVKFNTFINDFMDGIKKFAKPIGILLFTYLVFVVFYMSPVMSYVASSLLSGSKFNTIKVMFVSLITNVFHTDLGYTGYSIGGYLNALYPNNVNAIAFILTSIQGLISMITPTSVLLMFGLSYMDVDYGKWVKFIAKFILAMLVILTIVYFLAF